MLEMLQLDFVRFALISSSLIGLICSYMGVFVVLRRIIFVGIALAQVSALGVAAAMYFDQDPTTFALLFTIAGVVVFAPNYGGKRFPREAIIGIGFAASWAFAILVLSKAAHGEADMLNLVRGNILGTTHRDIENLLYVIIPVAGFHLLFYRQFLFVSFDSVMASTLGVKSGFWDFLFYLLLGLVVSVAIKTAGVLLTFSFLLLPTVTALTLGNSMRANFILSGVAVIIATLAGVYLSVLMDLPTGPAIAGVSSVLFVLVYLGRFIAEKVISLMINQKPQAKMK